MSVVLPRLRVVAALLAGRGTYRIAVYASGLALLTHWGPDRFAAYAAPVGAMAWVTALLSSGPEKAALNLIPLRGGAWLDRFYRTLIFGAFAFCLVAGVLTALWPPAAPYAAAGVGSAGVGCATVLVALYRLRGQPLADSLAFLAVAAGYAVAVAAAYIGAGPNEVLLLLCAAIAVVNVALLAGLRHPGPAPENPEEGPRIGRRAGLRAAVVLGIGEVLAMAGVSALYALLAASGEAAETSLFYLLLVISAVFSTGWGYLLRLAQPTVAVRFEASGEHTAWWYARRCLLWTLALGLPAAVAVAVLGRSATWAYAALAVEIALYAANAFSALLLEASGARGRRWSATGAVAQLIAVAGVGWLLVPVAGAVGGIAALIAGELARAALLLALTRANSTPANRPDRANIERAEGKLVG